MATSERKKQANKKNAQRSTGPRTPEGKTWASNNSRALGAYARAPYFEREEDKEQFEAFCNGLQQDLGANGLLECLIVRNVAWAMWLLPTVQALISQQMRLKNTGGYLALVQEFMNKSDAVKLPLPGLDADQNTNQQPLAWEVNELDLHLVGADHAADQSQKVTAQNAAATGLQDKLRNDRDKRTHFELKTKVTDRLERLQRNEADLMRNVKHWLKVLYELRAERASG